jgi:hypothetical protein
MLRREWVKGAGGRQEVPVASGKGEFFAEVTEGDDEGFIL